MAAGVKEMRAKAVEAMRAEILVKANDPVRAAYCQGVQDALAWATSGEAGDGLTAMSEYVADQHANGRAWSEINP